MSYKTVTGWFDWLWRSLTGPFTPSAPEPAMSEDEAVAILNHECDYGQFLRTPALARLNSIRLHWACPVCGLDWGFGLENGHLVSTEVGSGPSMAWESRRWQARRALGLSGNG